MCNGSNWGFSFLIMTYNILIDQRFAVANKLTIVQTTTLAACMTLPTWTNTITVDGIVWYQYSETKMVDDFPLLFSIPKRVYKNIKELADRGFPVQRDLLTLEETKDAIIQGLKELRGK